MWDSIGQFRDDVTSFLQAKDHAFVGGVAVRSYAARSVPTKDYDVMIDPHHLQEFTRFLEGKGAKLMGTVEATYSFRIVPLEFDFDLRIAQSSLDREALSNGKTATYAGKKLGIVAPEVLAAMKVKAYSERKNTDEGKQDASDVRGLVKVGATTRERIRVLHEKHRPDRLAFVQHGTTVRTQRQVVLMDLGSKSQRVVAEGVWLTWSPDGRRLAYERDERIFVLDLETGRERELAPGRRLVWAR